MFAKASKSTYFREQESSVCSLQSSVRSFFEKKFVYLRVGRQVCCLLTSDLYLGLIFRFPPDNFRDRGNEKTSFNEIRHHQRT